MIGNFLKYSLYLFIVLFLGGAFLLFTSKGTSPKFNPGKEFNYKRAMSLKNSSFIRNRAYILLKDSTQIAVTYLLPEEENEAGHPIILLASPYTSTVFVPEMKWYERVYSKWVTGSWGPEYDYLNPKAAKAYTALGYAVVLMDFRGTGSSTGFAAPGDVKYIEDFKEILDWLENQSWSNGKIGMEGQSYLGWAQFAAAATKHPALKCIVPAHISFDMHTDNARPGGIKNTDWIESYSNYLKINNSSFWNTNGAIPSFPAVPLTDMDNDGVFIDEIPQLKENKKFATDSNSFTYDDGFERPNNPYISMLIEREKNLRFSEVAANFEFIDDTLHFENRLGTYQDVNPISLLTELKKTKIPVLFVGGFFDYFEGIPQLYSSLKDSNPSYLFMGPRFHVPLKIPDAYKDFFEYNDSYSDAVFMHTLRFFDHYLKEIDNGFEKELPVKIYTPFKGWNNFSNWPVNETTKTTYFLNSKTLSLKREENKDTINYSVDFTHSGRYGDSKINPNNAAFAVNDLLERSSEDLKCLVFETKPLISAKTLTGYPIINLNMSSNLSNTDIYVYLTDVAPDGKAYYIAEAQLRAGWHRLVNNDELVNGAFDVKPELPWHSFKKLNYDPKPFNNGMYQTIRFNLKPHSWRFKKGHKIRISIAGADKDNFEFNPTCCSGDTINSCNNTEFHIATGGDAGSYIELPFINTN